MGVSAAELLAKSVSPVQIVPRSQTEAAMGYLLFSPVALAEKEVKCPPRTAIFNLATKPVKIV